MTNVFDHIREEVMGIFDKHAGEVETVLSDTAAAADSPLGIDVASLAHIPPASLRAFGAWLVHLDADLAEKAAMEKQAADPTAGDASASSSPDPASADAPSSSDAPSGQPPTPAASPSDPVDIPAQPTYQN